MKTQVTNVQASKQAIICEIIRECEKCFTNKQPFVLVTRCVHKDEAVGQAKIAFANSRAISSATIYKEYSCQGDEASAFTTEVIFDVLEHILHVKQTCLWGSYSRMTKDCVDHSCYFPQAYSKDYSEVYASPISATTTYFT